MSIVFQEKRIFLFKSLFKKLYDFKKLIVFLSDG